jgi:hypothetical protein
MPCSIDSMTLRMPESAWLTQWEFEERHGIDVSGASPEAVLDAVIGYDERDDALVAGLIALREWPSRAWRSLFARGHAPSAHRFGRNDFLLLQRSDDRIVYGLAGRFWRPDFALIPIDEPRAFLTIDDPGIALLTLEFRLGRNDGGARTLETVTRVHCTDAWARRRFAPYWFAIRPFSGLIRRRMLRRIRTSAMSTPASAHTA